MHCDFQVLTMGLFDDRREFRDCKIFVGRNLNHIYFLKRILPDRLPRAFWPVDQQELLMNDGIGESGIETLDVRAAQDQLAS
jgi:hypothetical protein